MKNQQPVSANEHLADALQSLYEEHRIPDTWGTGPSLSQETFRHIREENPLSGIGHFLNGLAEVGDPRVPRIAKAAGIVGGFALITFADTQIGHKNRQEGAPEPRNFGKMRDAAVLFTLGSLLVTSSWRGSGGGIDYDMVVPDVSNNVPDNPKMKKAPPSSY